jgi:4-amino-4-deoxy-L-arabinose transferase-like glycosyltransferase
MYCRRLRLALNNTLSTVVKSPTLHPYSGESEKVHERNDSDLGDLFLRRRLGIALIVSILSILTLTIWVLATVPPTSRDALTHHLALPKLWIIHGGFIEIPELIFSYYPMNLNLLYSIPLLFGNDILPKYIHFFFALATAGLIYSYLQQRTSRLLSLLGALLFLSTPVIVKLAISAYVDLGLIFFTWASIYHLLKWTDTGQSPKYLILSAIFCGLGLGTKYNGLVVLLLLTLSVPIFTIRRPGAGRIRVRHAMGYSILFFVIAMTVFSPWMIRNYRLTGNPVYPMYNQLIGNHSVNFEISNMTMKPWLQRKLIYQESALETAFIPIRIFFQGKDDDPRYFDGKLNPILCLFPIFVLLGRKKSGEKAKLDQGFLIAFSILFLFIASFLVDMRIRYISPIIPPLVVLTVFSIEKMQGWIDSIKQYYVRNFFRWFLVGSNTSIISGR